jgi:branched-chain amino acid transport system permease protein
MELGILSQTIVNSITLSSMYILMALGFALMLSIMGILNFAHGAIYMVGGYICYWLSIRLHLNTGLSLLISALTMGLFGLFLERYFLRPFQGKDPNRTIFVTIAMIFILEGLVNFLMGGYRKSVPALIPGSFKYGPVAVSGQRAITFIIGCILLVGLMIFIKKTRTGKQMLAISQDIIGASLQGIKIHRVSALATSISCALAGVTGSLLGSILQLSPYMGDIMLVKAVEVVVLAGIGSISGVPIAGLILGTIDATLPIFSSGSTADAIGLGLIIVILIFRPQGLFGHEL